MRKVDKNKLVVIASILLEEFEEDDDVLSVIGTRRNATNSVATSLIKERRKHFRLGQLYKNDLNWIDRYLDSDFHRRFRMKKETYRALVEVIRPHYPVKEHRGDAQVVDVERAVIMTLHYLGQEVSMDYVGDKYGFTGSTVHKEVHRIVAILCSLKSTFIVWPTGDECHIVQQQFHERAGFPGVVGAIDGCHVEVLAPAADQDSYTDRKSDHSIILQGVCTATKIFTNVSVGTPGSRNDCRALAFSSLYRKVTTEGHRSLFYDDNYHLVGDKAYPNRSWLLAPFKNYGNLTRMQRRYNYKHSVTRVVIEHTFGLLKGRWRRLLFLTLKDVGKDSNFVLAACVLHNFCYLHNDTVIQDMAQNVRMLNANGFGGVADAESKRIGDEKRDVICRAL